MRRPARCAFTSALFSILWAAAVTAQPAPERIVGPDYFGKPLVISKLTATEVGALAAAAGVPMGFEAAIPSQPHAWKIEASGRPLRAVLDAIVAEDPRYEWREDSGVVVLRASAAWTNRDDALYRSVGPIRFEDVGARAWLGTVAVRDYAFRPHGASPTTRSRVRLRRCTCSERLSSMRSTFSRRSSSNE